MLFFVQELANKKAEMAINIFIIKLFIKKLPTKNKNTKNFTKLESSNENLMKNVIVSAVLLASLLLSSCTKEIMSDSGDPVEFNIPQYSADLKAVVREDGFISGDAVAVMGYYVPSGHSWDDYRSEATPDFMYNCRVAYDGNGWSYSPTMYWPQIPGATVNFYSYFPYSDGTDETGVKISAEDKKGEPSFDFVLNERADVDLMVAKKEGCSLATGTVDLGFHHVLGKLQFRFAVSNDGGFSYIVNKIKVLVTPKRASYTWSDGSFAVLATESIEASAGVDAQGCLIDSTTPRLVDDFTMFLMPSSLGVIHVAVNNEIREIDLSSLQIESGKVLTVTFIINLSDIHFTTSVTDWIDGGEASGDIS